MSNFNPHFIRVDTVEECADLINKPHEDYPDRVDDTVWAINLGILFSIDDMFSSADDISEFDCKSIHSLIMHDLEPKHKGQWRNVELDYPVDASPSFMIAGHLEEQRLFPMNYTKMDESDIIRWYRAFQIIHPFIDGNGRVGGVIVAIASNYLFEGKGYLAPCPR
jgi:hypothetical protein